MKYVYSINYLVQFGMSLKNVSIYLPSWKTICFRIGMPSKILGYRFLISNMSLNIVNSAKACIFIYYVSICDDIEKLAHLGYVNTDCQI